MNAVNDIRYQSVHAAMPGQESPAQRRARYYSEHDFLKAVIPPAIAESVPLASPAPDDGLVDFSQQLGLDYPATLPTLLAATQALTPGESRELASRAGAGVLLVLAGDGTLHCDGETLEIGCGDIVCLPGDSARATAGAQGLRLYLVDDSPLLRYLGWRLQARERSPLIHYPAAALARKLDDYAAAGITASGVFLGQAGMEREKLVSPVLFAHLIRLMPGAENIVHSHSSPALTYVIAGGEGCYSLLGERLDAQGRIDQPRRIDWQAGQISLTPPVLWHGHFNHGQAPILALIVQVSGLYYHDRSMNFRFAHDPF